MEGADRLDQVDPKWPSHLPLTTSMGSMGGAFQGRQGYPTIPIYISQRLVPDSGVQLQCMEPVGSQGIVQSSLHTALYCTRPFKIKPTLLSASHNPQGGDDLDCPVKLVWSLLFLPKPCLCGGQWHCVRIAMWSARGLMSKPKTPPPSQCTCCPSILRGLPVWSQV